MLTCDQALERISAQLDNELTDREEALLEEHLQGCAACRALQTDFQALHTALQESAAAWTAEPPAALAQDVMAAVRAAKVTPFQSKRQAWRRRSWACAAAMLALRGPITGVFQQTPEVTALAHKILLIMALTLPLRFVQYIHICGILRSGADGKKAAFYDSLGIWCVSIPIAFGGMWLGAPFLWVYLTVVLSDSLVKDTLVLRRFFSKKWMIKISG